MLGGLAEMAEPRDGVEIAELLEGNQPIVSRSDFLIETRG
jgi:hypothetical protein